MTAVPERPCPGAARGFLDLVEERFEEAAAARGSVVRRFSVGGLTLELRFAGPALVQGIVPALEHLPAPPPERAPGLTVRIWDSVSTGVAMPPPPWSSGDIRERGEVRGFNDERFRTAFSIGSGILNLLDLQGSRAVLWLRDAAKLAYWETGAPLLTLMNWWFGGQSRQLVHAAAVGRPEGGVLLAGKGGSGKSTTALGCLEGGLAYAADDYCLLEFHPRPRVHSLYNTGKLNRDNLERFPRLGALFREAGCRMEEKALVFLNGFCPEKLSRGFPLKAVLLPRVTGASQTRLVPVSPAAGLTALAPSTIFQLSGAGSDDFARLTCLVRRVPCYRLDLGVHLEEIPGVIAGLLEKGEP